MAQGLITVRSLAIYAGVRVSLTDHVTFQNRISKDLIDLVPPPPHSIFHLPGRCYAFMIVTVGFSEAPTPNKGIKLVPLFPVRAGVAPTLA